MFLIEFDELTGTVSTPVDVSTRLNKKNKFSLSYHQYGHTGVYLVAKKKAGSSEHLDFTMEYAVRQNMGMSDAGIGALSFFMPLIFLGAVGYALYYVHTEGIYEVRIPRLCRCLWCKDYVTPEEKEARKEAEALRTKIRNQIELNLRLATKANEKGFNISDSYFADLKEESERDSYRKAAVAAKEDMPTLDVKIAVENLSAVGEGEDMGEEMAVGEESKSNKTPVQAVEPDVAKVAPEPSGSLIEDSLDELRKPKMDFFELHNPNGGFNPTGEIVARRYVNRSEIDMQSEQETKSKDLTGAQSRPNLKMESDDSVQRLEEDGELTLKTVEPQVYKIPPTDQDDELNRKNISSKAFFDML
jgi:hypothetical protein